MKNIAIIGAGKIGQSIIKGLLNNHFVDTKHLYATTHEEVSAKEVAERYGIEASTNNLKAVENADIVLVTVKPYNMDEVLKEIAPSLKKESLIISSAAGYSIASIASFLSTGHKIVRMMPNTPVAIQAGVIGFTPNEALNPDEVALTKELLSEMGLVEQVTEAQLDTITGVSGSSPTLVYMFIEAMADAACQQGLPRQQALALVAQTVAGSAQMVIETHNHPGQLKDDVCSPAGTSIECVRVAEDKGLRSAVIEAVIAACQKAKS